LAILFWDFFERIKPNRKIQVSGVKKNDVFFSVFRNVFEYIINEVTMGIEEGKSSSVDDIRVAEELEKF
jgi:hypothetical protein